MNFVEWGNRWLEEELEKKKQYNKKFSDAWSKANPERIKAAQTKYYEANREEVKKRSKVWCENHPDKRRAIGRAWVKAHPKKVNANIKSWRKSHPKQVRESREKTRNKRKRNLGYIPLNVPFVDSQAHHIDKDHVVYIPSELHRSISHSVLTSKNMKEINKLVLDYFKKRKEVK